MTLAEFSFRLFFADLHSRRAEYGPIQKMAAENIRVDESHEADFAKDKICLTIETADQ